MNRSNQLQELSMDQQKKRPTLKRIAELAGVTPATVSMVLNNTGRVSEEQRKKVKLIADEIGYRPDAIAQGLVKQRLKLIGMVVPSFHDDFSHEVFLGIEKFCKDRGYKILVGLSHNEKQEEISIIEEFLQLKVAGLIVHPSPNFWKDDDFYQRLQKEGVPFVFYTRYPREGYYDRVLCDDLLGGQMAVQHLIEKGHKRIAFYTNRIVKDANDSLNKKRGYELAHEAAGLIADPELSVSSDLFKGERTLADWIEEKKVSAIFVSTDYTAINLMLQLQDRGIRVPEDVAIVGYDDIRMASMCSPKLTTVKVPKQTIGLKSAEIVISAIEGGMSPNVQDWVEKPELIIRGSS
jgi:LacI family transcriptional regulator